MVLEFQQGMKRHDSEIEGGERERLMCHGRGDPMGKVDFRGGVLMASQKGRGGF